MRGLVAVVIGLIAAATAAAGVNLPPRADAANPVWISAHTVAFDYAQEAWDHARYQANDDGGGFMPSAAPLPGREHSLSPDGAHRAGTQNGQIYVDGRPVHAGTFFEWLSPTRLAVGLEGYAAEIDSIDLDGRHARPLVTGYDSVNGFDISPDGTQIAFTALNGWGYDRGAAVYVARIDGTDTDVRRISPDVCTVRTTLTTTRGTCFDGTNGDDRFAGTRYGDIFVTGAGDDVIHAGDGENVVQSQWGDDTVLSGSGIDFIHAGSGDDMIGTGAGGDYITPGPGRDVAHAGSGDDHVIANDGERDVIDCGPGDDRVRADRLDVVRNCEHVTRTGPSPDQGY